MSNFNLTSESAIELEDRIKTVIRDVPDFPKPGILFKDVTPIFRDAALSHRILDHLQVHYTGQGLDAIVGVESRGFLFGFPLAMRLGIPFVPVRKAGKLPGPNLSWKYDLEYGSAEVEMQQEVIQPGWKVLVHDDLLATGGTAAAAAELIRMNKAEVAGFSFLVGLDFLPGRKVLESYAQNNLTLATYK